MLIPVDAYLGHRNDASLLGVYALYDASETLQYVGFSRNMCLAIKVGRGCSSGGEGGAWEISEPEHASWSSVIMHQLQYCSQCLLHGPRTPPRIIHRPLNVFPVALHPSTHQKNPRQ